MHPESDFQYQERRRVDPLRKEAGQALGWTKTRFWRTLAAHCSDCPVLPSLQHLPSYASIDVPSRPLRCLLDRPGACSRPYRMHRTTPGNTACSTRGARAIVVGNASAPLAGAGRCRLDRGALPFGRHRTLWHRLLGARATGLRRSLRHPVAPRHQRAIAHWKPRGPRRPPTRRHRLLPSGKWRSPLRRLPLQRTFLACLQQQRRTHLDASNIVLGRALVAGPAHSANAGRPSAERICPLVFPHDATRMVVSLCTPLNLCASSSRVSRTASP